MAVYSAQIQTMNDQIRASQDTVNTAKDKIDAANAKSVSYDNPLEYRAGILPVRCKHNSVETADILYMSCRVVDPSIHDGQAYVQLAQHAQMMNANHRALYFA